MEELDYTYLSFWFRRPAPGDFNTWRNSAALEPDEQAFVRDVIGGTLAKPERVAALLEESRVRALAKVRGTIELAVAA